jgi:hypothetical protein
VNKVKSFIKTLWQQQQQQQQQQSLEYHWARPRKALVTLGGDG